MLVAKEAKSTALRPADQPSIRPADPARAGLCTLVRARKMSDSPTSHYPKKGMRSSCSSSRRPKVATSTSSCPTRIRTSNQATFISTTMRTRPCSDSWAARNSCSIRRRERPRPADPSGDGAYYDVGLGLRRKGGRQALEHRPLACPERHPHVCVLFSSTRAPASSTSAPWTNSWSPKSLRANRPASSQVP